MYNYLLTIQYDGSRYKGWQRQGEEGGNTIQSKIENVLAEMVGKHVGLIGSSRTDAGVHALDQKANFRIAERLAESEVQDYLNRYLPEDISVTDVTLVPRKFHARFHAKSKTYLYRIWNRKYPNPIERKYSMHIKEPLDLAAMRKASQYFIGAHDFTAFSNAKSKKKSMVREIYSIEMSEKEGFIEIRIRGNGFLHNMVRKIVGALIQVGLGEMEAETIPEIIESKDRSRVGLLADACGLFLEKVELDTQFLEGEKAI